MAVSVSLGERKRQPATGHKYRRRSFEGFGNEPSQSSKTVIDALCTEMSDMYFETYPVRRDPEDPKRDDLHRVPSVLDGSLLLNINTEVIPEILSDFRQIR
jgi:hypothetical protein